MTSRVKKNLRTDSEDGDTDDQLRELSASEPEDDESGGESADNDSDSDTSKRAANPAVSKIDTRGIPATHAWVEKYRPGDLDNIIGNRQTIATMRRFVERTAHKKSDGGVPSLPHMLFFGPPGSGKTTTISVMAKMMYKKAVQHMVLELNASNDRGIDVVRQKIIGFVTTANTLFKACGFDEPEHKYKLVILDEVESMTSDAQATLRRLMEETSSNARFCLICNSLNRIDLPIQSRCVPFRFQPIDPKSALVRLTAIAKEESVNINNDALAALCDLSNGDMRKCINVLQLLASGNKKITDNDVYKEFRIINPRQVETLLETIRENRGNQTKAYRFLCHFVLDNGMDIKDVVTGIYHYMRTVKMTDKQRCVFLVDLARLEGCLESLQCIQTHVGCIVGILADWSNSKH